MSPAAITTRPSVLLNTTSGVATSPSTSVSVLSAGFSSGPLVPSSPTTATSVIHSTPAGTV